MIGSFMPRPHGSSNRPSGSLVADLVAGFQMINIQTGSAMFGYLIGPLNSGSLTFMGISGSSLTPNAWPADPRFRIEGVSGGTGSQVSGGFSLIVGPGSTGVTGHPPRTSFTTMEIWSEDGSTLLSSLNQADATYSTQYGSPTYRTSWSWASGGMGYGFTGKYILVIKV